MTNLDPITMLNILEQDRVELKSGIKYQLDNDYIDVETITGLTQKLGKIQTKISCWNSVKDSGLDNTIKYMLACIINKTGNVINGTALNSNVRLEAYSDWLKSLPIAIRVQYNLE